jgi:hypothetical protein
MPEHRDAVYHCYSSYAPGTEFLVGYYAILDRAPNGRDEGDQAMSWLPDAKRPAPRGAATTKTAANDNGIFMILPRRWLDVSCSQAVCPRLTGRYWDPLVRHHTIRLRSGDG